MEHIVDAQGTRTTLMIHIACWQLQLKERLTPLLRNEIRHLSKTYLEALGDPNLDEQHDLSKSLASMHDRLTEHWNRVYKDPLHHTMLLVNMIELEQFIAEHLQSEYLGSPFHATEFVLDAAHLVECHRAGVEDDDNKTQYQDTIVTPLTEMGADIGYVEDKLLWALGTQHQERLGSRVRNLISQRNWPEVATVLVGDNRLALDLHSDNRLDPGCYETSTHEKVIHQIAAMEEAYFAELSSPTGFKLTKHAMEKLPVAKPTTSNAAAAPPILNVEKGPKKMTKTDRVRNLLNHVSGGIKSLGTGSAGGSRAGPGDPSREPDEKTPLVRLKGA